MTSASSTVYLVTGANRGIGFGLVEHILQNHLNSFVYAGARNPTKASGLEDLIKKYPGRLFIFKCVSANAGDVTAVAKEIKKRHGRVDTVIANAGFANVSYNAHTAPITLYQEHFTVNTLGPVVLFQGLYELLKASSSPRFVPITTGAGSIGSPMLSIPIRTAPYGSSKAALNHITRKIHFENEWLIAFPLAPGVVETEALANMINNEDKDGVAKSVLTGGQMEVRSPQQAATDLIKIIDEATREKDGGEFINIDGTKLPW